jgi:hypothetical protein
MLARSLTCFPIVIAGLFSAAIGLSPNRAAADDCLGAPNREAGPGEHWAYHSDTINNRKCWHLVGSTPAAAATPAPDAQSGPGLQSFFSSLGISGPAQGAPQGAANRDDARPSATDPPKRPRIASRQDVSHQDPSHQDSGDVAAQPKRHRDTRPAGDRADLPLDEAKREALFHDFLRWKAQHNQD